MERVSLPSPLLEKYAAYARVRIIGVEDETIVGQDELISVVVLDTLRKIRYRLTGDFLTNPDIDPAKLYQQASRVFAGKRQTVFCSSLGIHVNVLADSTLRALIARFLQAYAERLALYEGRMAEISVELYSRKAKVTETGALVDVQSVRDVSYSNSPTANAKLSALRSIISDRVHERSLVLTRNVDINQFVAKTLHDYGIASNCITGTMSDEGRRQSLDSFERSEKNALIVNRQVGGRGFDLPIARFAVFLSPKRSEETMWQEIAQNPQLSHRYQRCVHSLFRTNEGRREDFLAIGNHEESST